MKATVRGLQGLVLLALAACQPSQPVSPTTSVVELVYATPYAPTHPFSRADQDWMAFVEQRSGGSLRIRPNWSGAVLSAEHSMVELRHGLVDIGLITPIYVKGGVHLIRTQSGFYSGTDTFEEQVALYYCMARGNPLFERELAGLKVLAVQGGSLPGILTRQRPVKTLADLQGLRIRAPTELLGVLEQLGADPVNMPMGEVYSALAKGVIDGVVAPADTLRSLHFAEVARHFTTMSIPRGAYPARAMGERRWRQLSAQHQTVLEEGIAVWEAALSRQVGRALQAGFDYAQQGGIELIPLAGADQSRFDALYLRDAERNARALSAYDIDGLSVFRIARSSVAADGAVHCKEDR